MRRSFCHQCVLILNDPFYIYPANASLPSHPPSLPLSPLSPPPHPPSLLSLLPRLQETRSSLRVSDQTAKDLGSKLEEVQLARSSAEADLAIEKQWRASLQVWGRGRGSGGMGIGHHIFRTTPRWRSSEKKIAWWN